MRYATLAALAAVSCAQCLSAPATAQDYPDRPIRMLTPSLPGGAPDVGARVVAREHRAQGG